MCVLVTELPAIVLFGFANTVVLVVNFKVVRALPRIGKVRALEQPLQCSPLFALLVIGGFLNHDKHPRL